MVNLSQEIPLSHFEFEKLIVSYYNSGVLRIQIKNDCIIGIEDLPLVLEYVDALDKGPYLNLFEFHQFSSTDDQIRQWASDPLGNKRTIADAIVIHGGLDQKILSDAYIKVHQPVKPTVIFTELNDAVNWLLLQKS